MRIGLSVLKFVVAVAVVAMVSSAMAQGQGGGRRGQGGGFGGRGLNALVVLQNETVQNVTERNLPQAAGFAPRR